MSEPGGWSDAAATGLGAAIAGAVGGRLMYNCYRHCGSGKRVALAFIAAEAFGALMMGLIGFGLVETLERVVPLWAGVPLDLSGWPAFMIGSWCGWFGARGGQMLLLALLTRRLPQDRDADRGGRDAP